ncbi:hypothetical protein [Dokdonella sp.]|uniref:hypothetical protein n=1 Tax=Dokdonella sp. TaxID=2291710 RepID=UPI0037842E52
MNFPLRLQGLLAALAFAVTPVSAAVITVGETGAACDATTLEDAITQAGQVGGHDEIRVTRDVVGGSWHANLVVDAPDFDLIGGFETCDASEPQGRTSIVARPGATGPVLSLRDAGDVGLVHLDVSGGISGEKDNGAGIEYVGGGLLVLEDVSVTGNGSSIANTARAAVAVTGTGGAATLRFKDRVSVSDNAVSGIHLQGDVRFESLGHDVEISRNQGYGLHVDSPSSFDLGGNGKMFAGNANAGIFVVSAFTADATPRVSKLYSIDATDPVRVHANGRGAIVMSGNGAGRNPHRLCTKNVSITGHDAAGGLGGVGLVDIDGASVELSMNAGCDFPPEADIECDAIDCRLFGDNHRAENGALVLAHNAAKVSIDRAAFLDNSASSIAVANVGSSASASSLRLSSSLIARNVLGTQVLGAYNGAAVQAIGLTVVDNEGLFARSLFAADAGSLDVRDSIIDQPQPLLAVDGDPATARLTRLLARNADGMHDGDTVMLGQPIYAQGSYRQAPDSPGIDRAPGLGGHDAGDGVRDLDTIEIPDADGPRDLGAYELQVRSLDYVFADDFEEHALAARSADVSK